jgi:RNA polymerase sigma factor (sigma-70 family)
VGPDNESPTDAELVMAWRSGDSLAGERLIERHRGSIRTFFSNKAAESPEDLVQQTLLACWESFPRYEGRSGFRAFLFGIARNVLYHHYRDEHDAFDPLTSSVLALKSDAVSLAGQVSEREESHLVLRVMQTLPIESQLLLELAYWEEFSDRELSEILGVPVGTIKSRLRKARKEIGKRLELASTTGTSAAADSEHHSLESWAAAVRGHEQPSPGTGRR